jgi:hypothetical protein
MSAIHGTGEHNYSANCKRHCNTLNSAEFFVQYEYANNNRENWGNEVTECRFNDVVVHHCPNVCCPVNGEEHACERYAE